MRKLALLAGALLLAAAAAYPEAARGVARKLALPFRVALLAAREPDARLALPVEGARVGQIADTWHAPRPGGRLHEGQDIFAKRGTVVRSAAAGYVVRAGENALGGKVVLVVGAGGRSYYYAHLDDYAPGLSVGDYVTTETPLGYVGTTGNAAGTPPHLHFGVYAAGGAVNPLPLLEDRGGRGREVRRGRS